MELNSKIPVRNEEKQNHESLEVKKPDPGLFLPSCHVDLKIMICVNENAKPCSCHDFQWSVFSFSSL